MNENDNTLPPIVINPESVAPPLPEKPKPLSWWLRKLFACNPFYLISAALLLYGCYRVSVETPFFNLESARLLFNFTSVQCYEIMLVLTAIFLARRSLWYDATLLVGLENLLVFVPFILISQAALIDSHLAQMMCVAGVSVAVLRFSSLKKYFSQLNLPGWLLGTGLIMLALNVALPLIYRHFGETKIGVHIDSGTAYKMNEYTWLLILPAVLALANFLPRAKMTGDLLPQHRWLPAGLFTLWIAVTCVHLYGLDYIYQFDLRSELIAPAAWVLAWTVFRCLPLCSRWQKYALTFPPVLMPLLAVSPGGTKTFVILAALNLAGYSIVSWFDRTNRMARHLIFASVLLLIAGLPEFWLQTLAPGLIRGQCIAGALMAYLIVWIALLPNPKLAIAGAFIFGVAIMCTFGHFTGAIHWAVQGCSIFLLLHSLRWNDANNPGAGFVRMLAAVFWVTLSFVWMNSDAARFWMPFIPGALVLGIYLLHRMIYGRWEKPAVPAAAILVMLSGPGSMAVESVRAMPVGLLAVAGSFLLFGFGTAAALTRNIWHKRESQSPPARTAEVKSES